MRRQKSAGFYSLHQYCPIKTIAELTSFRDKNGNTAAHHAANMGLHRTADALFAAGSKKWVANVFSDTPAGLLNGLPMCSGEESNTLHRAVAKHGLLDPELIQSALRAPKPFVASADFARLTHAILGDSDNDEYDGAFVADELVAKKVPHAKLYRAIFYLIKGYGTLIASGDLRHYLREVVESGAREYLDPLYFYARYLLWKMAAGKPSHAKRDKLLASGTYVVSIVCLTLTLTLTLTSF